MSALRRNAVTLANKTHCAEWRRAPERLLSGCEAILELADLPWFEEDEHDESYRAGYDACLRDVLDALADEWDVELTWDS